MDGGAAPFFREELDATPIPSEIAARPRDPGEASGDAVGLARALGVSLTAADVLARRGLGADDRTRRFLDPKLAHLTPPDKMADRALSAERIARAIRAGERVCVFGDYDCDGITSAAIMTSAIRSLGGDARPVLSTRLDGSYGLSHKALTRVFATGATLLVTCDCGSSDHERLAVVKARGVDAVVIDHHLVPSEPLPALAFLNPHRPDCGFAYKGLASCGLAISLAAAIRKELGASFDVRPLLDLAAIGTIADVAPLDGDNRAIVRAGLGVMASGARPGIVALAELAKIDLSYGLSGEDIAFRVAPRLNAPGRLGDPDLSLELLLEASPARAVAVAASIEQIQLKRRAIQDEMLAEAFAAIEANGWSRDPAIVIGKEGWHPGVVGIAAGRIASRFGKPTIVIAFEGARGRGSVRGPAGSQLHDALTQCRHALAGFGGHQAAAGCEVRADRVSALRDAFCGVFQGATRARAGGAEGDGAEADVRLDDRDDPRAVVRDLARLEPCGERNPAPKLFVPGARVLTARNLKGHLKIEVQHGRSALPAFLPERGDLAEALAGGRVDLVAKLRRDTYRGGDAVELKVERLVRAS